MRHNLPLRNNNPLLARIIPKPHIRPAHRTIRPITVVIIQRPQRVGGMRVADAREVRAVFVPVACAPAAAARPRSVVTLLAGVFADEAREEARGDGFEGGDGGGEDADVGLDDGPVHRVADYVGRVRRGEHRGDVGDSDDGGDAGTIQGTVSKEVIVQGIGCPGNRPYLDRYQDTYNNPRESVPISAIFCFRGTCSLKITLIGNEYVKTSVRMLSAALQR